jgi:hypothetical protein
MDVRKALEVSENAIDQAELLLLRERFDDDPEVTVVRAVLRTAKAEARSALAMDDKDKEEKNA